MSDDFITRKQVDDWFTDLELTLQQAIVSTRLGEGQTREDLYNLYQASQILKVNFLGSMTEIVEMVDSQYDPD